MSSRYSHGDIDQDEKYVEEDAGIPDHKLDEVAARRSSSNGKSSGAWGTLSLSDYEDEVVHTSLTFELSNGRTATARVSYDPNMVNDAALGDIRELSDAGDSLAAAEVFCRTVKDWTVTGELTAFKYIKDSKGDIERDEQGRPKMVKAVIVEAGEKVPLDPEVVQYVRSDIVLGIWTAINQEASNTGKKDKNSRRGLRKR